MTLFNRVLWIILGAVLTAAGVVGILARLNVMPGLRRDHGLITPSMDAKWNSWGQWATAGVMVAGVILAVLGVLLFRAQVRHHNGRTMPDLRRSVRAEKSTPEGTRYEGGRTRVATSVLNRAFTRDLQRDIRVRRAAVRLTGARSQPDVRVQLAVAPDADVVALRDHVDRALVRFNATSGLSPTLAEVVVKMSTARPRVH